MIDIHCHILPGVDDGPPTLQQSIELSEMAVSSGISTIIATPHHLNGRYTTPSEVVKKAVDQLNLELSQRQISLQIKYGQEVHVHPLIIHELYQGKLCTLANSRYMLLELPFKRVPVYFNDVLHELKINHITPIIAHPERNAEIVHSPRLVDQLIKQGVLFQITAHSITGLFGRKVQKWCFHLCKKNYLHFISSDAHHVIRRNFALKESYATIGKIFGNALVNDLKLNAQLVVENLPIVTKEDEKVKRSSLLWR
ncbi:tyrosine-protein phosphatase [Paenibacillus crassostreae]|uniref:Tyrosine-protein phosphatase n=1 Tax=Paenibacillus crassostreae TaxID=1763538 RepID=A0A167AHP0_9BACL|nr:CpsB/CapC family capsule biosynthesis tyrosine phosphatase [Paenibacillus crassostreae]AOZ92320.1 hypothetical protein LPB68_08820 [Paenibacillus crassostreae]OAB71035.1 hypothetical protein PNBC_20970 [Paenibacillus crassostreae]